ncbi:uncharacterized protein A4U43_C07F35800 [Asparagus officinalis]|uniref:Ubiquitin receptor RAD23 n=1 Tax=Asparagus officinalis TaxID=4686 RepID=A0A5P1EKI3_ASPOF|nr:uncharacterized protein A4U43_C07F35800 [Asparagus officinalis]
MRIFIKTLKNSQFEIQVNPDDTVADVKKKIESSQGKSLYPSEEQMLIYQGKVLNDSSTINDNNVAEDKFIVIMLKKMKASSSGASAAATTAPTSQAPAGSVSSTPPVAAPATPLVQPSTITLPPTAASAPSSAVAAATETDSYGQAASNLVAGSNLEQTIQHILDMGGGTWDRDTVLRALRAAYNNPERAVEYLYSGIPEQAEVPLAQVPTGGQTTNSPVQAPQTAQPVPSSGPNANPLDLFPQGLPSMGSNAGAGNLDFLRNNPQPMLQELGKQNPQVMRLIQEHQEEFLRLMNESGAEGGESNPLSQLAAAMPQTLTVTPEEREAIERLEAMGFARALVLQVFFACNKNEEMTANYLLDHMHEFENDQ